MLSAEYPQGGGCGLASTTKLALEGFLVGNVAFDGFRGDLAGGGTEIGARPHRGHALEMRKLQAQDPRRISFDAEHDLIRREGWRTVKQEVNLIGHDFKRQNLTIQGVCGLKQELAQSRFNRADQHFSSSSGNPDKMVLDECN